MEEKLGANVTHQWLQLFDGHEIEMGNEKVKVLVDSVDVCLLGAL